MVKQALIFLLLPFLLLAQEAKITSEIEGKEGVANQTLVGTITITHSESDEVDVTSFRMKNKPLEVEFLKKVKFSGDLIISFYRFELEGKAPGLYMLPSVSAKVGDKKIQSIGSSYEVVSAPKKVIPAKKGGASLSLEASIEGSTPFYQGQRANFLYKIAFSGDIALTEESLPLLDAKGFRKIGDVEVTTTQEGGKSVQNISQRVEVLKPGTYSFPASQIAGYAYIQDAGGKKTYIEPLLKAEASPITVKVDPFPEKGKPPSFNGAVGDYTFNVALLSPNTLKVGDKLTLSLKIQGKGELENVPIPDLDCQPGWSGNFAMGDLPPVAKIMGDTKTFTAEVRPLTAEVPGLPPLAFSFFDPEKKGYQTITNPPIALKLTAPPLKKPNIASPKERLQAPAPVDIQENFPLTEADLHNRLFGTWWALLILPIGAFALMFQVSFKHYLETRPKKVKIKTAKELYYEAEKSDGALFYQRIEQALTKWLAEQGETDSSKEVKEFLLSIEKERFSGKEPRKKSAILAKAKSWIFLLLFFVHPLVADDPLTFAARQEDLNTALKLYTEQEEKYSPTFGNGKLYYNIGNTFFQLGEPSFALLNYLRAEALMPENPKLQKNMEKVLKELNVKKKASSSFPLPRRIQLFFALSLLTFIAASFYIWMRKAWLKQLVILLLLPTAAALLNLGYLHYISPVEAALVRPTAIYRSAGEEGAKVQEEPLPAGETLEVIGLTEDGGFAKILTKEGTIGYIPASAFRLIF